MEQFVTQTELEKVLKDLNKLRNFLGDTFGAKFLDFMKVDEDETDQISTTMPSPSPLGFQGQATSINPSTSTKPARSAVTSGPLEVNLETGAVAVSQVNIAHSSIAQGCGGGKAKASTSTSRTSNNSKVNLAQPPIAAVDPAVQVQEPVSSNLSFNSKRKRRILVIQDDRERDGVDASANSTVKKRSESETRAKAIVPPRIRTSTSANPPTSSPRPPPILGKIRSLSLVRASPSNSNISIPNGSTPRKIHKVTWEDSSPLLYQEHTCPLCKKKCLDFDRYEEHLLQDHSELDGKPCPICKKLLSKKTRLKRHLIVHGPVKYCCSICGKGYNRSDNLNTHYKSHEGGQAEEGMHFFCGMCNNAFASREGRDRHLASLPCSSSTSNKNVTISVVPPPTPLPPVETRASRRRKLKQNQNQSPSEGQQDPDPQLSGHDRDEAIENDPMDEEDEDYEDYDALASVPITISPTKETEKIKLDCTNQIDFEYEGDDD